MQETEIRKIPLNLQFLIQKLIRIEAGDYGFRKSDNFLNALLHAIKVIHIRNN